jgi:hypothetical protein
MSVDTHRYGRPRTLAEQAAQDASVAARNARLEEAVAAWRAETGGRLVR